jgi:FKBP-type peptidyl-prolyl cis-trans isomerase FkpA
MKFTRSAFTYLALVLMVAFVAASCGGDDTPSSPTPAAVNVPYSQTDLRVGTGAEAVSGRRVTVNYTGWFYDAAAAENKGRTFDSGSFSFTLGTNGAIRGFEMGVTGMRVGGQRRIVVPPNLAYGASGTSGIPPNSTLVFEMELISVS